MEINRGSETEDCLKWAPERNKTETETEAGQDHAAEDASFKQFTVGGSDRICSISMPWRPFEPLVIQRG